MPKKPIGSARLNVMVKDLREMKTYLLGDEPEANSEEMKGMDDFEKNKLKLSSLIHNLKQSINELEELRQKKDKRDVSVISKQNENHKQLIDAKNLWLRLKDAFEKQAKKKKLDKEVLEDRKKMLELFGQELMRMEEQNTNIRTVADGTVTNIERNQLRSAERAARRAARKQKTDGKGGKKDGDEEDGSAVPLSQQDQIFFEEKRQTDEKIDGLLDVISQGLGELKEIASDINRNLDLQNEMLEEVDKKIDGTIENYISANQRLKKLLADTTGGATTWCPILIAIIILLGLIAYIYNIAK